MPSGRRGIFVPLPVSTVAALLLAVLGIGVGVFIYNAIPRTPGDGSPEAGFLRDMNVHHAQAVEMALLIRDRTDDENLNFMTTDMMLTQSTQMGIMQGFLIDWDLNQAGAAAPMAWMGHPVDGLMPGMATPEQIEQLRTLPVAEAEVLFLQLMIRHHQGGVEMAQAVLDRTDNDQVRLLAERIVVTQDSEVGTMNAMLEARGQAPITDPLPDHGDMGM